MSGNDTATLPFGPVQLLVLGFERTEFDGEIMPEIERLKDAGIIRLIDLIFVTNNRGVVETIQTSDLSTEEAEDFGAIVGALIGAGMGDDNVEAGMVAGAEEGADGHVRRGRRLVPRRRDSGGDERRSRVDRAPLGNSAAGQDHCRGRSRARRRVGASGRPDRGRRARSRSGQELAEAEAGPRARFTACL